MKKILVTMAALSLLVVSGQAFAAKKTPKGNGDVKIIKSAEEQVSYKFKDPDSVKFKCVHYFKNGNGGMSSLYGLVDGKNSYGAYTGYKVFSIKWSGDGAPTYGAEIYVSPLESNSTDFDIYCNTPGVIK